MTIPPKPAHFATPTSRKSGRAAKPADTDTSRRAAQSTAAIALNMSWQLLIVVVLPVLGGHWLDGHWHASPLWTVVGLAVSIVGMVVVVRRTMQDLNAVMNQTKEGKK